jgi:DNA-binding NarL/FixJ family response regulator
VALIDDYDIVVLGVARMLEPFADRIRVVELDTNLTNADSVDIALYDSFAQSEADPVRLGAVLHTGRARRVVVYTWNLLPELVDQAREIGVHGYLSKTLSAEELVDALERVHADEPVFDGVGGRGRRAETKLNWPGRDHGLTERESEILALITQGRANGDVAAVAGLSLNTVKSYIRSLYRKIDAQSRTQAVLWGVEHGFMPTRYRIRL